MAKEEFAMMQPLASPGTRAALSGIPGQAEPAADLLQWEEDLGDQINSMKVAVKRLQERVEVFETSLASLVRAEVAKCTEQRPDRILDEKSDRLLTSLQKSHAVLQNQLLALKVEVCSLKSKSMFSDAPVPASSNRALTSSVATEAAALLRTMSDQTMPSNRSGELLPVDRLRSIVRGLRGRALADSEIDDIIKKAANSVGVQVSNSMTFEEVGLLMMVAYDTK